MVKDDIQRLENTPLEEIIKEAGKKPARYGLSSNQKAMSDFVSIIGKRNDILNTFIGATYAYAFNYDGSLLAFVRGSDVYFFPTANSSFNRGIAKRFDAAQRQR